MSRQLSSLESGRSVFLEKCACCHSLSAEDSHSEGPNLHGIMGRKAGSVDFAWFSRANREAGFDWNPLMLRKYLVDPQSLVPGGRKRSSMVDRHEVDDLILFLERASEPKMKLFQKADEFIEKIVLRPKAK